MHTPSICEIPFEPVPCPHTSAGGFSSALVKTYGNRVFTIARHITQNDTDAGNVLVETFLQVCPECSECGDEHDLWRTFVTVVVKEAFSALHKKLAGPCLGPGTDPSGDLVIRELSVWGDDEKQRLSKAQTTRVLEAGLRNLDPMARAVFVLHDIERLSIELIARILNRSAAAVDVCLLRARLQLRETLVPYMRRPQ